LARVGAQIRSPQGQENTEPTGPVDDRQKHGGGPQRCEASQFGPSRFGGVVAYPGLRGLFELRQA
jgi:hypothetical protein